MRTLRRISLLIIFSILILSPKNIYAHCDGLDGPVVKTAMKALESNNVNLVLIWVQKEDEYFIKDAFKKTLSVRKLNEEAKDLADMYFFETLVRIHRAGEGEPYTGLKPAGRDLGAVIPAADLSIEKGKLEPLEKVYKQKNLPIDKIQMLFKEVIENKNYNINDVDAGRKYVKAYVEFLHTAEHLYDSSEKTKAEKKHKLEKAESNHKH
ncbi:MAG: DUF6448 family protein [Ignavibacteriales bacterium]|nr:DUF6448 family protein [Ignavibacteriales bacterium]